MPQLISRHELEDLCEKALTRKRAAIIANLARGPSVRNQKLLYHTTISLQRLLLCK